MTTKQSYCKDVILQGVLPKDVSVGTILVYPLYGVMFQVLAVHERTEKIVILKGSVFPRDVSTDHSLIFSLARCRFPTEEEYVIYLKSSAV